MEKIIMVKPCQSGKTFDMIEIMKTLFPVENNIIILFSQNLLLSANQNKERIMEAIKNSESKIIKLDSERPAIKTAELFAGILERGKQIIITLSNPCQTKKINQLFENSTETNKKYHIFMDEADDRIKFFSEHIKIWEQCKNVSRLYMITATPQKLYMYFKEGTYQLWNFNEPFNPQLYHRFQDSEFNIHPFCTKTIDYIKSVIEQYDSEIPNGSIVFVPGDRLVQSHEEITTFLFSKGMNCIIINGNGITLYTDGDEKVYKKTGAEPSKILSGIYEENHLSEKRLAIIGRICVGRGITLMSEEFLISHAIFSPKHSDIVSAYQLTGRICGNIKRFANYKAPIVYCTRNFHDAIIKQENKTINFGK